MYLKEKRHKAKLNFIFMLYQKNFKNLNLAIAALTQSSVKFLFSSFDIENSWKFTI